MCPGRAEAHPSVLELTSVEQAFLFPQGLMCSAKSEPLTYREAEQDTFIHTPTHTHTQEIQYNAAYGGLFGAKDPMGLKIENSGLPPMKVLISKKLHILRPAIEYVQQISKPKKVRLTRGDVWCL